MEAAFTLVLHAHLPYVRGAGRWPHGEEWVHEAILACYLPLLVALHDLRAEGVRFRMVLSLTPILLEQLADPDIDRRFLEYADDQISRANTDANRLADEGNFQPALVAADYRARYTTLRDAYLHRFSRDLCGAFASLARSGEVEILTSAATHGYLPLLDEVSVDSQLRIGRASSARRLGITPTGIWLPECAYRPGLERALERNGLTHFFTDPHLLSDRATARASMSLEADRSGGALAQDQTLRGSDRGADAERPYLVDSSRVAVIARHDELSLRVWSSVYGYPGDPMYREFHRKDPQTGLRYWRVTGPAASLGEKSDYVIEDAQARVAVHAEHFVDGVRAACAGAADDAFVVAAFDAELFGHWWYEGVEWLTAVLRRLADARVRTRTAAEHLALHPPLEHVALAEGSWGKGNDHSTWVSAETAWMFDELVAMAARLALCTALPTDPPQDLFRARAARQAVRELLLAQSSDWPFLVTTGQAAAYASDRFRSHAQRFSRALELAREGGAANDAELLTLEGIDNPFPDAT